MFAQDFFQALLANPGFDFIPVGDARSAVGASGRL